MEFAHPLVILLISPIVLGGWYAVRRGVSRAIVISRVIILSLLVLALASPFTMGTTTVKDEAPRITVLSDRTISMDLFNKDTGQKIFEAIKSKTPSTYRQFEGMNSPVGDEIIQNAENNNIVLVSDGNSNRGKDLEDAISLVSRTGSRVFAVRQKPVHNDASVEIAGAKNLIVENDNVFNIVVRQAGNSVRYRLDVEIDGKPVSLPEEKKNVIQTERTKVIPVPVVFKSLGKHEVKARITPGSEDWFRPNNVFYKSVYVVPKPKVLAVTDDTGSSLYKVINTLYQVTAAGTVPDDLSQYKAVIIDNKADAQMRADILRTFVAGGGGLVVVGGDASYDKGGYNNSPAEAILPIISRSAEFGGGRTVIIIIDASTSTAGGFINYIDANAINIIQKIGRDSRVGVVAFGGDTAIKTDLVSMSSDANKAALEKFVRDIGPKGGDITTDLDKGLHAAEDLLESVSGTKEIIVLSDGIMPHKGEGFEPIKNAVEDLTNKGIKIHFVQVLTSYEIFDPVKGTKTPKGLYEELARAADGHVLVLNPDERASTLIGAPPGASPTPTPAPTPEISYEYPVAIADSSHFITKYINLSASVTGYNDVTPKLGAERLVATTRGKPILTTWSFGLGRVVSFTTDNGGGMTMWASALYAGENSRLISAMVNWAIGDPRHKEGVVIQAEDIWGGTPGRVVITSNTLPQVKLDKKELELSRTGPTTYEATINPDKEGFHDLSGYGIAVNYPMEYRDVGFNEKLDTVIEANGGRVYDENGVEGLLLMDIKEKAVRTFEAPQSEKEPFLLAALVLFLLEVIIRRLKDYRKERPDITDNPPRAAAEEAGAAE